MALLFGSQVSLTLHDHISLVTQVLVVLLVKIAWNFTFMEVLL